MSDQWEAMNANAAFGRIAEMLFEFNNAFGHYPAPELQVDLVTEEANEFFEACLELDHTPTLTNAENFVKEFGDLMYVTTMLMILAQEDLTAVQEAIADKPEHVEAMTVATAFLNIANGNIIADDDEVIEIVMRVHQSNMSKLQDDGTVLRNDDGKVLKGPNYEPPYLEDIAREVLDRFLTLSSSLKAA